MDKSIKNIICLFLICLMFLFMFFTMVSCRDNIKNSNHENVTMSGGNPPSMPSGEIGNSPDKPNGDMENMTPPDKPGGEMNQPGEVNNNVEVDTKYYVIFAIDGAVAGLLIAYLIVSGFNRLSFKETFVSSSKTTTCMLLTIVLCVGFTFLDSFILNKFILGNEMKLDINFNNSNKDVSYSSSKTITSNKNVTNEDLSSSKADENAVDVNGNVESYLSNLTVNKTGDSDGGDSTSFYGTNSAIIARNGANVYISDSTIETNANGANGVFSYGGSATTQNSSGDGTTVNIVDSKITTTKDNSGGIMTTGGGVMNAANLIITTSGTSSAAIRSDRGGGTVNVNGGTYTTNGKGSPAVYSTANITVKNATLISNVSEGVVIEGKNSVTLEKVTLTDTNNKLNGQSTTYKNIFLYQSMSGDADTGVSTFTSKESKITTNKGDTLYVTNTSAVINLENNSIVNKDIYGNFIRIKKDSWGNEGSNGGNVTLNMSNQSVGGNVVVDELSTLEINLSNNSSISGQINKDNTAKSLTIKLDSTSKLILESDSYVTSIENEVEDYSNVDFNGYALYVNGKAINK